MSVLCAATKRLGTRVAVVFTIVKVSSMIIDDDITTLTIRRSQHWHVKSTGFFSPPPHTFSQVSITILGVVQLIRGRASTSLTSAPFKDSSLSPSAYALALYSGLWAFDGWDQTNYVGGEMKDPGRNIPRAIHLSMALVTVSDPSSAEDE